jgi:TfoX/Sxy family transcriptional regulator of competence genes
MKLRKSPSKLIEQIAMAVEGIECEKRLMFGFPAYFINKNMFAGLFEDKLFLRLSNEQAQALVKAKASLTNLEPMPGRPMKDYWVLPAHLVDDPTRLKGISNSAATYTRSLKPKEKKPPKKSPE